MQVHIRLYAEDPTKAETRVYLKVTTDPDRGKPTTKRVCVVPNLLIQTKYWTPNGVLLDGAPQEQRELLDFIRARALAYTTDVARRPRVVTPSDVKAYIWPEVVDNWAKMHRALQTIKKPSTHRVYTLALERFRTFCRGQEPTGERFAAWAREMAASDLGGRTARIYLAGVRGLFRTVEIPVPHKVERKALNPAKVYALSAAEFRAIRTLDLSKSKRLSTVRDAFVCACLTALRVSDWGYLTLGNLGKMVPNKKTGKETQLNNDDRVRAIIERNGGAIVLPSPNPNKLIQTIAKMAAEHCPSLNTMVPYEDREVPKWMTIRSHTARRTFVTLGLQNGAAVADLKLMTGHASDAQLYAYAKEHLDQQQKLDRANSVARRIFGDEVDDQPLKRVM